jgi:ribonuclease P/MRP protein subunit RPP1
MPYHDLNLPYTSDTRTLNHTISFAQELGYGTIALSTTITGKLPSTPPALDITSLQQAHPNLTLLTRLNLSISDPSQNHRLSQFSSAFSLLALRPLNEKSLLLACTSLDCDLITLDFTTRLPFLLKFKTLSAALQRGIRFEITYSPSLLSSGSDAKRNLIAGATSLIRATRGGRGIILSSDARTALGLRGPHDVINLAQIWGLEQARGKEALCEEAGKVVRLAALRRKSYRGVITVVDGGGPKAAISTSTSVAADGQPAKQPAQAAEAVGSTNGNGVKRKASTTSLTQPQAAVESTAVGSGPSSPAGTAADGKPLSKREQKRRAKKARLEGYVSSSKEDGSVEQSQAEGLPKSSAPLARDGKFAIRHESLVDGSAKKRRKGT